MHGQFWYNQKATWPQNNRLTEAAAWKLAQSIFLEENQMNNYMQGLFILSNAHTLHCL